MKKLLIITLVLCFKNLSFGQLAETLRPLEGGEPPKTLNDLWAGYDPCKEPLDVEILKEWEEEGVVMKVLRYRIGVFKGKKAMMAAVYGYPKGAKNVPGLVQMHGGGQSAHYNAVLTNAKRGYATISIAWAGRLVAPDYHVRSDIVKLFWEGKTEDPDYRLTTDWGGVDAYHAPCRYKGSNFTTNPPSSGHSIDPVESPRNSGWFLSTIGSRRALTFLQQQPEVDPERLGAYGHSMGGKLTVMLAGIDARVKAAAPSCGGVSNREPKRAVYGPIMDDASLVNISCPIFFLSPANDFHGNIDDLQTALGEIKSTDWRITCAPHHQHQDTKDYEVATQIWFDQILKKSFVTPETPRAELKLKTGNGVPELDILPDTSKEILSVDVFVSRDAAKKAADRFWHHAPAKKGNGKWTASLELYGLDKPLWVYANVRYKLDQAITGAGYYYGIYTTDSFVLSSELHMISPQELKAAGVQSVLQADGQIEDFSNEWEKEWYIYDNDPKNWRLITRRFGDDLYAAPAYAKLVFSARSKEPNQLVLKMDDKVAVVELAGNDQWQECVLYPMDFKGTGSKTRQDWAAVNSFQITDRVTIHPAEGDANSKPLKVGSKWQGAAPELRTMRWVAGTKAEHNAHRKVKLLDTKLVDGETYLNIDNADSFSHGYKAVMNTWLDDASPLKIDGKTYTNGLTTHAHSEAVYFLGGKFKNFRAMAQAGDVATVVFQVFVDDVKVFDSGLLTGNKWEEIDVSVENAQELKLVVTDGGNDRGGDHASWVDVHLQK